VQPTITHVNPEAMHSNPAFSQAVVVEGAARTIYVGGQNAVDADGRVVGAGDLAAAGATLWAQDEASSVVWGMPGSLVGAGLADDVIALDAIGPALAAALHGAREPGLARTGGGARG